MRVYALFFKFLSYRVGSPPVWLMFVPTALGPWKAGYKGSVRSALEGSGVARKSGTADSPAP